MGELRAALGVIFGNALKSIAFATTGALVGYLLGDLTGLAIGATLALVVGLVLF